MVAAPDTYGCSPCAAWLQARQRASAGAAPLSGFHERGRRRPLIPSLSIFLTVSLNLSLSLSLSLTLTLTPTRTPTLTPTLTRAEVAETARALLLLHRHSEALLSANPNPNPNPP